MAKKSKTSPIHIDFHTGIGTIIPSTQEAFKNHKFTSEIRTKEKEALANFKHILGTKIDNELRGSIQFPSQHEVFIFIVQYFASRKEYGKRDIDNLAKTILDVLEGRFYSDDSQVKSLLVGKKMEKRITQNFAYIAIKELKDDRDIDVLKISGLERSVFLYQELKKKGLLG